MNLEYNEKNLKYVTESILKNLTSDLLVKKYIERNKTNPTFGHCHTVAGCLYKIFGYKNLHMHRAIDEENIWHWWCVDKNNNIIDLTADQYYSEGREPPYKDGKKATMLGFKYRERVMALYERVKYDVGTGECENG